jgi:hypothetical protein
MTAVRTFLRWALVVVLCLATLAGLVHGFPFLLKNRSVTARAIIWKWADRRFPARHRGATRGRALQARTDRPRREGGVVAGRPQAELLNSSGTKAFIVARAGRAVRTDHDRSPGLDDLRTAVRGQRPALERRHRDVLRDRRAQTRPHRHRDHRATRDEVALQQLQLAPARDDPLRGAGPLVGTARPL